LWVRPADLSPTIPPRPVSAHEPRHPISPPPPKGRGPRGTPLVAWALLGAIVPVDPWAMALSTVQVRPTEGGGRAGGGIRRGIAACL